MSGIPRRSFLLGAGAAMVTAALPKVADAKEPPEQQFECLREGESILGKQMTVLTERGRVRLHVHDIFTITVGGSKYSMQKFSIDGEEKCPHNTIGPTTFTVKDCIQKCTVGPNNKTVILHTRLGTVSVTIEQIQHVMLTLLDHACNGTQLPEWVEIDITVKTNTEGDIAIAMQKTINDGAKRAVALGIRSAEALIKSVELPTNIGIGFAPLASK